jgi:hypothetical protein
MKTLVLLFVITVMSSDVSAQWRQLPGAARDVGSGGGVHWSIGWETNGLGYPILRWSGSNWFPFPGSAVNIAVDNRGNPWIVNSVNEIYKMGLNEWQRMPGYARDIGAGSNGAVWVIGSDSQGADQGIYHWNGADWERIDGAAVRITVDSDGNPWVVNSEGNIYRRLNGAWQQLPGKANDIGAGADGSVWVIGTNNEEGGHGIFKWNGSDWSKIAGGGVRIAIDNTGKALVSNNSGFIYSEL